MLELLMHHGSRLRGACRDTGREGTMTDGQQPVDGGALLAAIAMRGDRDAFAALFGHFAPRVKGYLLRMGLPDAQAEELAQETMLTVWRRAEQFDPATGGASAWIFTIARNLRVDAARRDRLAPRIELMADQPPPPPGADALMQSSQHADRVRQALARLPADQAEVVRLSFFDDRPHAEIERALGIPLGTVKSRLRLAMTRLRAILDDIR
ncbi:sigma-70 family RNA polymerase sigma factor [Roseomonas sp. CAU 1739]|uniref:sigma-70 family RNA polymerase sigma factor n=1 Tax=Roseomonas sp. CAU 1739 TaxID=3140364 RepID=UPI00325B2E4F